ncbi:MAG: glycogen synthase GlgA [Tissierellia bacterium]|nr:glycogen synthase GlgA [Tissierellia bacterium]
MKIFYIAAEASPFIKTGGLADVAGSLPKALAKNDQEVSVVLPLYSAIDWKYRSQFEFVGYFYVDLDWRHQYVGVFKYEKDDVNYYFIDNEYYFARNSLYGEIDDGERFIFFNRAVVGLLKYLDIKPDIVHANDWHTGLIPLYLKDYSKGDSFYKDIKSVYTIHNIKYQGIFKSDILSIAGLGGQYYNEEGIKYYDCINMMKAGIVYCDLLTTVSHTYAQEIRYSFFGQGLDGIIRKHQHKLKGIINGIDYDIFNPKTDKTIDYNYDAKDFSQKKKNKAELQRLFHLPENPDVPLIGMVTRLVDLKGIDLLDYVMDELMNEDIQLVVLGTGENNYEDMLKYYSYRYKNKLAAGIYFDEAHSKKIYAGADFFLMPSVAEPCGISQLIAMRYGTIPIVRETGGLSDTVIPYNKYTNEGTGFGFKTINAHEMLYAIKKAIKLYQDKDSFNKLIKRDLELDNSWNKSSIEYLEEYKRITNG